MPLMVQQPQENAVTSQEDNINWHLKNAHSPKPLNSSGMSNNSPQK